MKPLEVQQLRDRPENTNAYHSLFWLVQSSESDYMAMRFLFFVGNGFLADRIVHLGAECLKKIMKAFIQAQEKGTLREIKKKYGHNLKEIRAGCSEFDRSYNDDALQQFCQIYSNTKMNELLRYGMDSGEGSFIVKPSEMIQMVDHYFLKTIIEIDAHFPIVLSKIAVIFNQEFLMRNEKTRLILPSKIPLMQSAIKKDNLYLNGFLKRIAEIKAKTKQAGKEKS